jgi:hypothetical protein
MLERFKVAQQAAVSMKADTFVFDGHEFVVSYAKYLIEYLHEIIHEKTLMSERQRDPRRNPRPGDRLGKVLTNRAGVSGVFSRHVLALEQRYQDGTVVVWTRKRSNQPCRCTLAAWRTWAKNASKVAENSYRRL